MALVALDPDAKIDDTLGAIRGRCVSKGGDVVAYWAEPLRGRLIGGTSGHPPRTRRAAARGPAAPKSTTLKRGLRPFRQGERRPMGSASHVAATRPASPGARWGQLVVGIVAMVAIANLHYGWTLFVNPMDSRFHWGKAAIQVALRSLS